MGQSHYNTLECGPLCNGECQFHEAKGATAKASWFSLGGIRWCCISFYGFFSTNGDVKQNEYRVPGARAIFLSCTLIDSLLTPPLLFASALVLGGKGSHLNVQGVFKPSHADYTWVQQLLEMGVHQCLN